jgi:Domain of unknown function (DUF4203)
VDLLAAVFTFALGLAVLFMGWRLFLALLPVIGFFVGFIAGAQFIAYIFNEGFLATVLGIVVGVITAIFFAIIAIFWWWAGVVIVIGAMGFAIGYGVLPLLGLDLDLVSIVIGLAVGAVFALGAIVLRLPRALVVVVTSLWGSGAVLAGIMILFGILEPEQVGYGGVNAVLSESLLWTVAWIVLAVVGMAAQITMSDDISIIPEDPGFSTTPTYGRTPPPRP